MKRSFVSGGVRAQASHSRSRLSGSSGLCWARVSWNLCHTERPLMRRRGPGCLSVSGERRHIQQPQPHPHGRWALPPLGPLGAGHKGVASALPMPAACHEGRRPGWGCSHSCLSGGTERGPGHCHRSGSRAPVPDEDEGQDVCSCFAAHCGSLGTEWPAGRPAPATGVTGGCRRPWPACWPGRQRLWLLGLPRHPLCVS